MNTLYFHSSACILFIYLFVYVTFHATLTSCSYYYYYFLRLPYLGLPREHAATQAPGGEGVRVSTEERCAHQLVGYIDGEDSYGVH